MLVTDGRGPELAAVVASPRTARSSAGALRAVRFLGGPAASCVLASILGVAATPPIFALILAAYGLAALVTRPLRDHSRQLVLMRHLDTVLGALLTLVFLLAAGVLFVPATGHDFGALLLVFAGGVAGHLLAELPLRHGQRAGWAARRIALIGPAGVAGALQRELEQSSAARFRLAGRVATGSHGQSGDIPVLGSLERLAEIVLEHDIDLLVIAPSAPRLEVFETVANSCLELPVRVVDLNSFCECVFGHVPVSSIDAAWFQCLMHPRFRRGTSPLKRAVDLLIAGVAALAFAPVLAVAALLIRRDGGPVFFMQTRIGEGGRPFRVYKLRTMRVSDEPSAWTQRGDARITPIGRILRRTHIDEIPQVINVLRGTMSIVGPRPEQPEYVTALEHDIPFYTRRHLIKPGITGWAQVRCGYAGSVEGSAWKMCHDLYYVKHRSVMLDMLILGETVRTLFADRQFPETEGSKLAVLHPVPVAAESTPNPVLAIAEPAFVASS